MVRECVGSGDRFQRPAFAPGVWALLGLGGSLSEGRGREVQAGGGVGLKGASGRQGKGLSVETNGTNGFYSFHLLENF